MKILFILIDGLSDIHTQQYISPLKKGCTPFMDKIAKSGISGLLDPCQPGLACGSDTAHMNLFGYQPFINYKGRGAFQALGSGLQLSSSQIAFKCNFAYLDKSKNVIKRRVDRQFEKWGIPLVQYINGIQIPNYPQIKITVMYANEHRCVVKIGGNGLSCKITGTDPIKDGRKLLDCISKDKNDVDALNTSQIINNLSNQIYKKLKDHQLNKIRQKMNLPAANIILLRGAGTIVNMQPFQQKYNLKSFMIAPTKLVKGIGINAKFYIPEVQGATGDQKSNFEQKFKVAIKLLKQDYQFGFIHIKAVDQCGHDRNIKKKIQILQKLDSYLQKYIQILKDEDMMQTIICLTGDHTTSPYIGQHSFQPVCISITNIKRLCNLQSSFPCDDVQKFNQIDCGQGALGRFNGKQLMPLLLKLQNFY